MAGYCCNRKMVYQEHRNSEVYHAVIKARISIEGHRCNRKIASVTKNRNSKTQHAVIIAKTDFQWKGIAAIANKYNKNKGILKFTMQLLKLDFQ